MDEWHKAIRFYSGYPTDSIVTQMERYAIISEFDYTKSSQDWLSSFAQRYSYQIFMAARAASTDSFGTLAIGENR